MKAAFWFLMTLVAGLSGYIINDEFGARALEPYSNVHGERASVYPTGVKFSAKFTKNSRGELGECALLRFSVYGADFDEYKPVKFMDLDGREVDESREAGQHSLNILISVKPKSYERYELRTQHDCPVRADDGSIVKVLTTRIFASLDLGE